MATLTLSPIDRARSIALRAVYGLQAALWCARARTRNQLVAARSDERGLTTAEYVVLGAFVVVAAALVGGVLYNFLQTRAGYITNTSVPGVSL